MDLLTISGSPHVHSNKSVKSIMYGVVIALIPAILVSVYFFGIDAARVLLVSVLSCLFFEWAIQKYILKGAVTITDGSAVITGILLAFNVPSNLPAWILVIGALAAIGIAKMSFGGLGKNPFNPALIGRVFMLISFPVQMTSWPKPIALFSSEVSDAISGATTLAMFKDGLSAGKTVQEVMASSEFPGYVNDLLGRQSGSLGEISALALLLGAVYMLSRKIITWHIPAAYIGSAVVFSGILWMIDPTHFIDPVMHLLSGGMILGVFFMATDMVTTPMTHKGQLVFGVGAGLLTILIRVWGVYPEGVSFGILIMNAFTPLINIYFKPKRFGEVVAHG